MITQKNTYRHTRVSIPHRTQYNDEQQQKTYSNIDDGNDVDIDIPLQLSNNNRQHKNKLFRDQITQSHQHSKKLFQQEPLSSKNPINIIPKQQLHCLSEISLKEANAVGKRQKLQQRQNNYRDQIGRNNQKSKVKEKQNYSLINLPKQMKQNPYFSKPQKKPQNRPILKLLFQSDLSNFEHEADGDQISQNNQKEINSHSIKRQSRDTFYQMIQSGISGIDRQKAGSQSMKITQGQNCNNQFQKFSVQLQTQTKVNNYTQDEQQQQSMHFYNESTYRHSQRQAQNIKNSKIQSNKYKNENFHETNQLRGYLQQPISIATFQPKQLKYQLSQANKEIVNQKKLQQIPKSKICFSQSQRLKFISNNQKNKATLSTKGQKINPNLRVNQQKTKMSKKSNKLHEFDYLYEQSKPKTKYETILDNYFKQNKQKQFKQKLMFLGQQKKSKLIQKSTEKRTERKASLPSRLSCDRNYKISKQTTRSNCTYNTDSKVTQSQNNNLLEMKKRRSENCSSVRKNQVMYYQNLETENQTAQTRLRKTYSKVCLQSCQKRKMKTQPIDRYEEQKQNLFSNQNSDRWMSLTFHERQQKLIQNRKQKQQIGKKQNSLKQVKNCTFKPKLTQFKGICSSRQNPTTYAKMYLEKIKKRLN